MFKCINLASLLAVLLFIAQPAIASVYGLKTFRSHNFPDKVIHNTHGPVDISSFYEVDASKATFMLVNGLANQGLVSIQSIANPGHYLVSQGSSVFFAAFEDSAEYRARATFHVRPGLADSRKISLESVVLPGNFIRHFDFRLMLHPNDDSEIFRLDATFSAESPVSRPNTHVDRYMIASFHNLDAKAEIVMQPGLADQNGVTLELSNPSGTIMRHIHETIYWHNYDHEPLTAEDATFYVRPGKADPAMVSLEARNMPGFFVRWAQDGNLYLSEDDGSETFNKDATFALTLLKERPGITAEMMDGMTIYLGNLHSHTSHSDGEGLPRDIYPWARNTCQLDFYTISDHGEQLSEEEWDDTEYWRLQNDAPGSYIPVRAFEQSIYFDQEGHANIFTTGRHQDWRGVFKTQKQVYEWVDEQNALMQLNHPGRPDGFFDDFKYYDWADPHVFAIETANKGNGNNSNAYLQHFTRALDKGWHLAPTAGWDNHDVNSCKITRTGAIMPALDNDTLVDTMRNRRLYSSDDPTLRLIFKMGHHWMGEIVPNAGNTVTFTIAAEDEEPITRIELITDGGVVVASMDQYDYKAVWRPTVNVGNSRYFFAKFYGENFFENDSGRNDQVAVSAPIWVK
ncbi:MAG: hypothetical protein D6B28_11760 [Gammaproteobacteria bacterium]|nr:MAG: hypothetical protein D6B28_11760 [Gammaproteobacteria bacterium]